MTYMPVYILANCRCKEYFTFMFKPYMHCGVQGLNFPLYHKVWFDLSLGWGGGEVVRTVKHINSRQLFSVRSLCSPPQMLLHCRSSSNIILSFTLQIIILHDMHHKFYNDIVSWTAFSKKIYGNVTEDWKTYEYIYWSRIHERTMSLKFLGIILRVLRLEVSVWNS